jgi:hypothetical protein
MTGIRVIKVPDVGEGIAEVELVAWHVKPGDTVTEDQGLADHETRWGGQQLACGPVGLADDALGVGDQVAVGRELEEVLVALARGLQVSPGGQKLLILLAQLLAGDLQLFERVGEQLDDLLCKGPMARGQLGASQPQLLQA